MTEKQNDKTIQSKEDVKLGRFISLVLRHEPEAADIALDENGWADVSQLLDGMNRKGRKIDMARLIRIVEENNKKRYSFNADKTKIRARQGHSVEVDVQLQEKDPPEVLYHGTAVESLQNIMNKKGLLKMSRQHVHLSTDKETAEKVGKRHGTPALLEIDAKAMAEDGFRFYLSENGVWLCEHVPCKYIVWLFGGGK